MRILIDLTQIRLQKAGVGVYAQSLVEALLKLDRENDYVLLVQNDDDAIVDSGVCGRIIRVNARLFRWMPLRLALEQIYIPYLVLKHRIDLVHSLHYSFPLLARAKRVVTIHDLTSFLFPELHVWAKAVYYRCFTRLAVRHADGLIFDSQATLNDCMRVVGGPKGKTSVVYLGVNRESWCNIAERDCNIVLNKFGIRSEYLLFVGTIEPRKNLVRLVAAFDMLVANGFNGHLVIAGHRGWHCEELDRILGQRAPDDKIILTGYITDEEKFAFLRRALIFVYPSLYEGFGIPVLESLSFGVPTITSNLSSLPEVAGAAALLVDPQSVSQLYEAMRCLVESSLLREGLTQKALAQSQKFSWSNTAIQTREMYEQFAPRAASLHS